MDAYTIGVAIALTDQITGPMNNITKMMVTAGAHTDNFKKQLKDAHDTMVKMSVLQNVGQNMFHGGSEAMKEMLEHGKEYAAQLVQMQINGFKLVEIEKARALANRESARDATTSYTDNLRRFQDLRGALGTEHAMKMLPEFNDQVRIMRASGDPEAAHKIEEQAFSGAKALELSGAMAHNDAYVGEQLDMMRRAVSLTHGRVDFTAFHNFFKQAKTAGTFYDDEYKYKVSQYFMQEMGGLRWGTENQAMNQTLNQGVMTVDTAKNLQKNGLIWDQQEITKKNYRAVARTAVTGGELWRTNPFEAAMKWQDKILERHPEIRAMKEPMERYKAEAAIINQLGMKTGTTDAISKMILNQDMLRKKEFVMYDQTLKRAPALAAAKKSPVDAEAQMKAQFNNALTNLGNAAMPLATKGMMVLAAGLQKVNEFMASHPMVPKIIAAVVAATTFVGAVVAIGASIAVFGTVAGIVGTSIAAIAGWIAAAVAAVTAVILLFSGDMPKIWKKICDAVSNFLKPLPGIVDSCLALVKTFILAFFGSIGQSIANAMNPIGNALAGFTHKMTDGAVSKLSAPDSHVSMGHGTYGKAPTMPNFQTNTANNQKTHTNIVGPISLNVHQQPGESGEDMGRKVISQLIDAMHSGLIGASAGGGTLESGFHHGATVG